MTDLSAAYDALRKADAAGNIDDAKRLADYIRGNSAATSSDTKDVAVQPSPSPISASPADSLPSQAWNYTKEGFAGIAEPAISMLMGAEGALEGGLRGIGAGVGNVFGGTGRDAADVVRDVQRDRTYTPRTATGKAVLEAAQNTMALPAKGLAGIDSALSGDDMATVRQEMDKGVGHFAEGVSGAATRMGASPEVAGAVGSAVTTAPAALGVVAGAGAGARAGRNAAASAKITDQAASAKVAAQAESVAQSAGIDWSTLGRQARMKIVDVVKESVSGNSAARIDPASIQRLARADALPVKTKLTEGQVTREPSQTRTEENLAQLDVGKPIRDRHIEQNQAITDSLDILQGRAGSRAQSAEQAGKSVDDVLRKQEVRSLDNVNRLYNKARRLGETDERVDIGGLGDFLKSHERPEHMDAPIKQLERMGVLGKEGDAMIIKRPPTINELELIRRPLVRTARLSADGESRHYAGQLIGKIDDAIPENAGGQAYQAARSARKIHAQTFEEPKSVSQIVGDKNSADRTVALENVWRKTVIGGDVSGLERVRSQLLNQEDRNLRDSGRKAWRDVVGQTVRYIKDRASSGAKDTNDVRNISFAQLKGAIKEITPRKLEIVLGKSTAEALQNLVDHAEDVKTLPPYKGGSSTVINTAAGAEKLFNILDKASHIPVLGHAIPSATVRGMARILKESAEKGLQENQVRTAIGVRVTPKASRGFTLREQSLGAGAAGVEAGKPSQ